MPNFLQSVLVRWLLAIIAFPLGGLLGHAVGGPASTISAALVSGALAGAVIGLGQGLALGSRPPALVVWAAATAVALGLSLAVVTAIIGQIDTTLDAVLLGAASGLVIGAGQAVLLQRRGVPRSWMWVPVSAVAWAAGWLVTASVGVALASGWPVYGLTGAITSQVITGVVIWRLMPQGPISSASHSSDALSISDSTRS